MKAKALYDAMLLASETVPDATLRDMIDALSNINAFTALQSEHKPAKALELIILGSCEVFTRNNQGRRPSSVELILKSFGDILDNGEVTNLDILAICASIVSGVLDEAANAEERNAARQVFLEMLDAGAEHAH